MNRASFIILILFTIAGCSPKWQIRTAESSDVQIIPRADAPDPKVIPCYNPLSYVEHPELIRMKYIRVNFHFMNSTDGRYNMPEDEVTAYAHEWIRVTNSNLERNMKMFLPPRNETPLLPIPYRYVITPDPAVPGDDGVYYHVDDELCFAVKTGRDRNISDRRMIKKYAVNEDSTMNIFVQTHHLDSIKSKTYKPDASGISLGSSVKIFGRWHERPNAWSLRGITNHEIAHSLGLSHTWSGHDGCDDTPQHPNCWNISEIPPCDTLYSNNMMDYNAHMAALTPCQIGKILMNMSRSGSIQRNILQPRWCRLDTTATITISDSMRWSGSMDLEGNLVLLNNARLEIGCLVSIPEGGKITIYPGAEMMILSNGKLHNACGDMWAGIEIISERKNSGMIKVMEGGEIEDTPVPLQAIP